ncbi:MAG: glycosyl transferase group 1 [Solirubrobacterales bacterium]|nr:glycosyl transferase group 1 [Solirubrobacterales bacterium]
MAILGDGGVMEQELTDRGVSVHVLGARGRRDLPRATASAVGILRRIRPDVVQAHLLDPCLVGLAAARAVRVPVRIFTAHHSHEPESGDHRPTWLADRFARAALATDIVAPSAWMRDRLVGAFAEAPGRVAVVNHGLDMDRWRVDDAHGAAVRSELGMAGGPVFVTVGRPHPLKNLDALVSAFAMIVELEPAARLLMVGAGLEPLAAQARDRGIGHAVTLAGRRLDMPAVLAASDVYVSAALRESFNLGLIEAMRMGLPVMATPTGIAPEVVSTGETGVLAEGPAVDQLARGLTELLALRDRWPELGREGARRTERFTAPAMVAAHEELYERLVAERRR